MKSDEEIGDGPAPSDPPLARFGSALADLSYRYFPDAFVFALAVVVIVFVGGLAAGEGAGELVEAFGEGFWVLIPFTMQMVLIIVGGFVVASSRPCNRLIRSVARVPSSPRGAVAFTAWFAMVTSLFSWGFSLIFTGLLVRELVRKVPGIDYRAIGAAAYLGLGSVWALGLSSSSALMQATEESIPAALLPITGVIPLTETIFLWQNGVMALALIVVSVLIAWLSCPAPERALTVEKMGVVVEPMTIEDDDPPVTPADKLERSPVLTVLVVGLMAAWLIGEIAVEGFAAAIDLNTFNLFFIAMGMLLHWRPRSFLRAVSKSVPATSGVIIQFPFYAGVFGMIANTGLEQKLSHLFLDIATPGSFPLVVAIYSIVLGVFIPSGGGKWILEAPYLMSAANELGAHPGWTVQVYNAAETLPNLINPFWMLPLMGILNVKARDLAGYSVLQLIFHVPVVLLLCWLLAKTF